MRRCLNGVGAVHECFTEMKRNHKEMATKHSTKTTSQKFREEGNGIFNSLSDDLAPVIRRTRLEKCLNLYNRALGEAYRPDEKIAAWKNLGMASYRMMQLLAEQEEDKKLVDFYMLETLKNLSAALENGQEQSFDWQRLLRERVTECVDYWLNGVHRLASEEKVTEIERVVNKLPSCARTEVNLELADALFKSAVKLQEDGNYKKCLRFLHECYRPLEEAKQCCTDDVAEIDLRVLEEDIFIQKCVAEAKQALQTGDDLLHMILEDEESLNMDMVWEVMDWLQQAIVLACDKDLEIEAIASSRIGYIYDKILKMRSKARERFHHCLTVASALHPRVFTSEEWFVVASETLERYQQEFQRAEEEKWENKRKKYIEELKPELDELKDYCGPRSVNGPDGMKHMREVLEFVYKKHPPKNPKHKIPGKGDDKPEAMKKAYQKAVTHYHPDRQKEEYGIKWKVLAEEICKELTQRYECLKVC